MNMQSTSQAAALDRYGATVAARMAQGLDDLPHDVSERLRAARVRAVANRQRSSVRNLQVAQEISVSDGVASLRGDGSGKWWDLIAAVLPLLALVVGLITITVIQDENRIREIAEVDAELLTDDLPPAAYVDPGFAQFVRSNRAE